MLSIQLRTKLREAAIKRRKWNRKLFQLIASIVTKEVGKIK